MRRSRNLTSTATGQASGSAAGSSGSNNITNTVPSLLKELHGLVLQIQVLIHLYSACMSFAVYLATSFIHYSIVYSEFREWSLGLYTFWRYSTWAVHFKSISFKTVSFSVRKTEDDVIWPRIASSHHFVPSVVPGSSPGGAHSMFISVVCFSFSFFSRLRSNIYCIYHKFVKTAFSCVVA